MPNKAVIIGGGFGGLGSAALLAKAGYDVELFEKNEQLGGRAGQFRVGQDKNGNWKDLDTFNGSHAAGISSSSSKEIFTFDSGPSWYLMPDVFEHFFSLLGENIHDHITLEKLTPSYKVFFKDTGKQATIYSDLSKDLATFEKLEPGSATQLKKYLQKAESQYAIAKDRFMYKNYDSFRDFFTPEMIVQGSKLSVLSNMDRYVSKFFKTDYTKKIMQYPLVFLGASPYNAPAIYNIMSHVDFNQGVYYPQGGMYELTKALVAVATKHGAKLHTNTPITHIRVKDKSVSRIHVGDRVVEADIFINNADMRHTDASLIGPQDATRPLKKWDSMTTAPGALLLYLGVKGQYKNLEHHNLVFSKNWDHNFEQIFDHPTIPDDPSFYVCNPSKTDSTVAPNGYENLFVLVPLPSKLDMQEIKLNEQVYADTILRTMEQEMNLPDLRKNIVYKRLFSNLNFFERFNSQNGSALGFAHTLKQTAIFRPNNQSKAIKNMIYVGANTNPGIGLPTTLISAELMFKRLIGDTSSGPLRPEQIHV